MREGQDLVLDRNARCLWSREPFPSACFPLQIGSSWAVAVCGAVCFEDMQEVIYK